MNRKVVEKIEHFIMERQVTVGDIYSWVVSTDGLHVIALGEREQEFPEEIDGVPVHVQEAGSVYQAIGMVHSLITQQHRIPEPELIDGPAAEQYINYWLSKAYVSPFALSN